MQLDHESEEVIKLLLQGRNFKLKTKPRVELTLKQKCAIINEAKRRDFQPENVKRTLNCVDQTQFAKEFDVRYHKDNKQKPKNF